MSPPPATGIRRAPAALRLLPALAALALIAASTIYAGLQADRQRRADFLRQVRMVAQALGEEEASSLSATETDLARPAYRRLKDRLIAIRSANPQCRFVYLMTRRMDGSAVFLADSEPETSEDYSPPRPGVWRSHGPAARQP